MKCSTCSNPITRGSKSGLCYPCCLRKRKPHSKEWNANIASGLKGKFTGEARYWCWKGDAVEYTQLHQWVAALMPKPKKCAHCGTEEGWIDLANKGVYNRDLSNWNWLCRKCHLKSDGRYEAMLLRNEQRIAHKSTSHER